MKKSHNSNFFKGVIRYVDASVWHGIRPKMPLQSTLDARVYYRKMTLDSIPKLGVFQDKAIVLTLDFVLYIKIASTATISNTSPVTLLYQRSPRI